MSEPFDILGFLRDNRREGLAKNEFTAFDLWEALGRPKCRSSANTWIQKHIDKGDVEVTGHDVLRPGATGANRLRPVYRWVGEANAPIVRHRKLGKHKADGLCWKEEGIVEIDERLKGKRKLETLVHEFDHFIHPDKSEADVARDAEKMASLLWSENVRIIDSDT